jgi:hypothetical protein
VILVDLPRACEKAVIQPVGRSDLGVRLGSRVGAGLRRVGLILLIFDAIRGVGVGRMYLAMQRRVRPRSVPHPGSGRRFESALPYARRAEQVESDSLRDSVLGAGQ